MNHKNYIKKNL